MRTLFWLITSPVAFARALSAAVAIVFASQAGVWYPEAMFADIAIIYSGALGIVILVRCGGDAMFSRELSRSKERTQVLISFLGSSLLRYAIIAVPAALLLTRIFALGLPETLAILFLAVAILIGNALRICVSPNFQIGYDYASFSAFVLLATVLGGAPFKVSAIGYSVFILSVYLFGLTRQPKISKAPISFRGFLSPYYFISEAGYFALAYSIPFLLVLVSGKETAGAIRSIEQIVVAGTFVLFLTNNRLFYDLSMQDEKRLVFVEYLTRYSLPNFIFFALVFLAITVATTAGMIPNVARMPTVFLLYSIAYGTSVVCGSAGVYLNFAGEERFVTASVAVGLVPYALLGIAAFQLDSGFLLVLGSVLGTVLTNLAQLGKFYAKTQTA